MNTLTFIVIDTNTHNDTNDIICYMIVFWELNSYWGNFKTFLHGEWNDEIWTNFLCVNRLDKFIMKCRQIFNVWQIFYEFMCKQNFLDSFWIDLNKNILWILCVNIFLEYIYTHTRLGGLFEPLRLNVEMPLTICHLEFIVKVLWKCCEHITYLNLSQIITN